jgi:transposase
MGMAAAAPALEMSSDERVVLERIARSETLPAREVIEARGLVMAADGCSTIGIARGLGVSPDRVRRWRRRFEERRVAGVGTVRPGRGRKPILPQGAVAEIVRVTLNERPADGATHWTTRTLAKRLGVSRETIRRVWLAQGLRPWRVDTFKVSNDPDFAAKLVDVVGLYLDPPQRAVVLCLDEKTQVQALDRTQPSLPLKRGRSQTITHDYKRNGTTDLFAALNLETGEVTHALRERHAGADVLAFFKQIDRSVPRSLDIHVVLDNLSAHKAPEVKTWLEHPRQARWTLHFTPTSSSWLNLVEGWFALLTNRRLKRGSFCSLDHLRDAITLWADEWNRNPTPFRWTANAEAILEKIDRAREVLELTSTNSVSDH